MLITGGAGGLSGLVARHLVRERGARYVVLASRRGPEAPGALELGDELRATGAEVVLARCDVSDRDQLAALIASVPDEYPLKMVVHAAGVLDDGVIETLTGERVERVLRPKIDAAWHLHELTQHLDLRAFVLFSSAAGVIGSPGQGNYAAGNSFLDALAAYRQVRGLPGHSLAWGQWALATEMTGQLDEGDMARMARSGMRPFSDEEGLELFDAASGDGRELIVPMRLDLGVLRAGAEAGSVPPLLSGLVRVSPRRDGGPKNGWLARRLAGAPEDEREHLALELVRKEVATVLGHVTPEAIPAQQSFLELGFDSLIAVELRNRLNLASGMRLSATLVFDNPTPAALAEHLRALLSASVEGIASTELLRGVAKNGSSTGDEASTFRSMLTEASKTGRASEFMALLTSASRFRPTFAEVSESVEALLPTRLSVGAERPSLICVSSLLAISGPHQYARFASSFRGDREVAVLPLPGFIAGELLPASMSVVVEAHAEAVLGATEGAPFVLAGHSTGGAFAYALASRLQSIGAPAMGVALIDTYPSASQALTEALGPIMAGMLERDGAYVTMSDTRLTAMAAYSLLLEEWEPVELEAPTLLVQASEPMSPDSGNSDWKSSWSFAEETSAVPGNHFTMMEDHADTTADALRNWLRTLSDGDE